MLRAGLRHMLPRAAAECGLQRARCFSSIPIVDVSALVQPASNPKSRQQAAAALHDAAANVGFFYATNTGDDMRSTEPSPSIIICPLDEMIILVHLMLQVYRRTSARTFCSWRVSGSTYR